MNNEIRRYRPDDESALLELESRSPLGTRLSIRIIRSSFSLRSTLFPESQIFVLTQNETIVGTMSVALKDVRVGTRRARIGYLFDARVDPDHRKSHVASELLKGSLSYLETEGAEAAYVAIASDNAPSLGLARSFGFTELSSFRTYLVTTYRHHSHVPASFTFEKKDSPPAELRTQDYFPLDGGIYKSQCYMGTASIGVKSGHASMGLWDQSDVLNGIIVRMPWYLRASLAFLRLYGRIFTAPSFPAPGEAPNIRYAFDLSLSGNTGKKAFAGLLSGVNNMLLEMGVDGLLCPIVPGNPVEPVIRKRSFSSADAVIMLKPLGTGTPDHCPAGDMYLDIRDI